MLSWLFLLAVSFWLFHLLGGAPRLRLRHVPHGQAADAKINELTEYASRLRAGNKFTSAEKVYLQILKINHKHAPTYSRLGTLYSMQRNYGDAIECFQIATQLQPSGSTYYNLGLGYFENRNYMKAIAAFEKSVMFEPTLQRYIGLAKSFKKISDHPRMLNALQQAAALDDNPKVLGLLAEAHEEAGQEEEAKEVRARLKAGVRRVAGTSTAKVEKASS